MRQRATVFAFFLVVAIGATGRSAEAAHLTVNCDKKETIRESLKLLAVAHPQGPNTLSVVGNCSENILIQSVDRLTLIAKNGASITDSSNGSLAVVDIEDSRSVTLQGFTITGGSPGVSCGSSSVCYLTGNTVQDSAGVGVSVFTSSHAFLESNVIQNNALRGSTVDSGAQVFSSNDIFQSNAEQGVNVGLGAYFQASHSSFLNNGVAIRAGHATLLLNSVTITGSVGNGVTLLGSAAATFAGKTTITGNGGSGVYLEDGSFAGFISANVTGNLSGTDIVCAPQFPITHFIERTGGITNCVESAILAPRENKK
jgi:parallel beta-helix repeat protein